MTTPAQAAAAADFGAASARKRGRDARWPYVPVIVTTEAETSQRRETQIRGAAYATRAEAVEAAQRHIARQRAHLERKLAEPGARSLRLWYGVPEAAR